MTRRMARVCAVDGCETAAICRGWCKRHYGRWSLYGDPEAPSRQRRQPPDSEPRACTTCGELKLGTEFYKSRGIRQARCKECFKVWMRTHRHKPEVNARLRVYFREYNARTADRRFDLDLQRKYGITAADYAALLQAQGGGCAICGSANSRSKRTHERLHVDHDHETGVVRGLLCNNCNRAIGLLGEDSARLIAAARYVSERRVDAVA